MHYEDGTPLGEKEGDEPQFDPGVITEGDTTYLYTGFCGGSPLTGKGEYPTYIACNLFTDTD